MADNEAPNRLTKKRPELRNYFQRLSDTAWVSIPKIDSARMFISVGSPMFIKINTAGDGRTGFAGPDLGNPSDPNQDVIFEWVEFTLDGYGYHGNTTRVDQFGFPLRTRLIGKDGYDRTLGETQGRAAIFADYEAQVPAEFRSLVRRPYRIVAPAKGDFNTAAPTATTSTPTSTRSGAATPRATWCSPPRPAPSAAVWSATTSSSPRTAAPATCTSAASPARWPSSKARATWPRAVRRNWCCRRRSRPPSTATCC